MTQPLMDSRLPNDVGDNDSRVTSPQDRGLADLTTAIALAADGAYAERRPSDEEKALPLPGWLLRLYFIFPIVLYIPDAIFNYFVYSDGAYVPNAALPAQISQVALWSFLSIGVVGMAYLLSVLAPWHWSNGHHVQAFFCWIGVLVATGITTWNSLSYRSGTFNEFPTDHWLYQYFPDLEASHISLTMVLVATAPPFWGLFWALVQPTQRRRSLTSLHENHRERLLRVQHGAELKQLRAEANAQVREAQLKGMAQTAAAARAQAGTLFSQMRGKDGKSSDSFALGTSSTARPVSPPPPTAGMRTPPPMRVTKGDALATFSAPSSAPPPDRRGRSTSPTPPSETSSERSRAPSAPADRGQGDDLGQRGSLDHVTPPGSDLPVGRVSRAPRPR